MSNSPIRTDRDLSEEVRRQFSEVISSNRTQNRFSTTFFLFLLQAISFSVKIFIRNGIGRLTFGIGTIIAAYFWVRYFMGGEIDFLRNGFPELPNGEWIYKFAEMISLPLDKDGEGNIIGNSTLEYLQYLSRIVLMFFIQLGTLLKHGLQWRPPDSELLSIYLFSYLVIFRGIQIIWQSTYSYLQRENFDPMSRGQSIVFSSLEGKSIWNLEINRKIILMWFDPIFVVLIGFLFWLYPPIGNFGIFIMISGVVLFFEERAVQYRERKAVLNKLATDRWTERVLNEYKEFREGGRRGSEGSFGKAKFAENEDNDSSIEPIKDDTDDDKPKKGMVDFD